MSAGERGWLGIWVVVNAKGTAPMSFVAGGGTKPHCRLQRGFERWHRLVVSVCGLLCAFRWEECVKSQIAKFTKRVSVRIGFTASPRSPRWPTLNPVARIMHVSCSYRPTRPSSNRVSVGGHRVTHMRNRCSDPFFLELCIRTCHVRTIVSVYSKDAS